MLRRALSALPFPAALLLAACDGAPPAAPTPSPVAAAPRPLLVAGATPGSYVDVSAADFSTCAVRADGTLKCVGSTDPTATPPDGQFTKVSVGPMNACAFRTDGALVCWGFGAAPVVQAPAGDGVTQVANGNSIAFASGPLNIPTSKPVPITCALLGTDGSIVCWGGLTILPPSAGTRTAASGRFVQVSAGDRFFCALRDDGVIECWGLNDHGEAPATRSAASGRFAQVSGGVDHGCALRTDGAIECWGSDAYGQAPATRQAASGRYTQVAAGLSHTCALRSDGVIECWGDNGFGQAPATRTAASGAFVQVDVGSNHSCGRRADGAVECWGYNGQGHAPPFLSEPGHVPPAATFVAPITVDEFAQIPIALVDPYVPGYGGTVSFTYALNCGIGYGPFEAASSVSCGGGDGPATRTVSGKVRDQDGDVTEYVAVVTIRNVPPRATLVASAPAPGASSFTVAFTDVQDVRADLPSMKYRFDCGDGAGWGPFGASSTTACLFYTAGQRTVAGEVRDKDGGVNGYSTSIDLPAPPPNRAPTAVPGGPYAGTEGIAVAFDGRGSSDPDGHPLSYGWDFGDGTTGTGATPTHAYADQGRYTVSLRVSDALGAQHTRTAVAEVANRAPTATFAPPAAVAEGTSIPLALTNADDAPADLATLQYAFDCGDGAGFSAYASSAARACPTTDNGARSVKARVRDKDGAVTEYAAPVRVDNAAPALVAQPNRTIGAGQYLPVTLAFTDAGRADGPWRWTIEWGDGGSATGSAAGGGGAGTITTTATRSYTVAGTYTVTLKVADKDGGVGTTTFTVTVR